MPIITISRGTFAGGEKLALLLAERTGYRAVSREQVYALVESSYGFKADELAELMEQAPTVRAVANIGERRSRQSFGERRRQLLVAVQASLCDLLAGDDAVYHGQAGHLLLPGVSHVVRVRLIAPRARRIELATAREHLTRAEAGHKIDLVDSERARWTQCFFGVCWDNPLLFDLVVNLECLTLDDAATIVVTTARLPRFQATEASRQRMADLALASHVATRLGSHPATASLPFEVQAASGVVRVAGMGRTDLEWLIEALQKIEGVRTVELS
jgi:cytidylate kinase